MSNSTQEKIDAELNGDKNGKASYKWMINGVYVKTMENLRNRINVFDVSNQKDYLK